MRVEFTGVELSEFTGFDLDRSTARAWSRFQARLADHVAEMDEDDLLLVEVESAADEDEDEEAGGCAPYVQLCGFGEGEVRCEVSSNEYLAEVHLLDPVAVETLTSLGWNAPTVGAGEPEGQGSANFYVDVERTEADRLAVMTVRALRDVFGVAHPAFLTSDNLADDDEPTPDLGVPTSRAASEADPEEPIAVLPEGREHLQALVDDALTPVFGHLPTHDEDEDIPVVSGSALIFVRVLEEAPAIQMFSALARGVTDLERAAFEVAVLNRDLRFIKFVLVEDRVMAYLSLPALPFVPRHLRTMLALMSETVDDVDDDLVARIGGRRAFDADPDEDDHESDVDDHESDVDDDDEDGTSMHPAMMTLLQLDAGSPGSVDPELAAGICEMDRALVLRLIAWNSEHEMQHAEQTTNLLRRALRIVVERELGREPGESSYDEPRRRPRRKSPSTSRGPADPSLEELDPDIWS